MVGCSSLRVVCTVDVSAAKSVGSELRQASNSTRSRSFPRSTANPLELTIGQLPAPGVGRLPALDRIKWGAGPTHSTRGLSDGRACAPRTSAVGT